MAQFANSGRQQFSKKNRNSGFQKNVRFMMTKERWDMKTKKNKLKLTEKPKRRRMTFSFESPEAEGVILMGDFNHWNAKVHPMKKDKEGVWRKMVMVYPGRYEYKFLVDGHWQLDPQNEDCCLNSFGSRNNVLVVAAK